jgi:hypothetical protein
MKNTENRTGLMEVYRASFRNFTLAAAQLQNLPADPIAQETALAEVEQARQAYSRSRDALVPTLLGRYEGGYSVRAARCEAVGCC